MREQKALGIRRPLKYAQLRGRLWIVRDAAGAAVNEIRGDGVVGQYPLLAAGACRLAAAMLATMSGTLPLESQDQKATCERLLPQPLGASPTRLAVLQFGLFVGTVGLDVKHRKLTLWLLASFLLDSGAGEEGYTYQSCTAQAQPQGAMEGVFYFVPGVLSHPGGAEFSVRCPRFALMVPAFLY